MMIMKCRELLNAKNFKRHQRTEFKTGQTLWKLPVSSGKRIALKDLKTKK
jgi:hypothetical protein